jgi:hypothetical protein
LVSNSVVCVWRREGERKEMAALARHASIDKESVPERAWMSWQQTRACEALPGTLTLTPLLTCDAMHIFIHYSD